MIETKETFSVKDKHSEGETKAEHTRLRILQAGFDEMYENGFQGMRIDAILTKTNLAKGALYHHFPNKKALGYAVVDELISARQDDMFSVFKMCDDPIDAICTLLKKAREQTTEENVSLGCPVNNLVQEMAGLDDGFKQRLSAIFEKKIDTLSKALKAGQEQGLVKTDFDSYMVAGFIVSSYNGIIGAAKCTADIHIFRSLVATLTDYVVSLRTV